MIAKAGSGVFGRQKCSTYINQKNPPQKFPTETIHQNPQPPIKILQLAMKALKAGCGVFERQILPCVSVKF